MTDSGPKFVIRDGVCYLFAPYGSPSNSYFRGLGAKRDSETGALAIELTLGRAVKIRARAERYGIDIEDSGGELGVAAGVGDSNPAAGALAEADETQLPLS